MLNYDEIVTCREAHRDLLLTNAAQQRLGQALATSQPHPVTAWIGRQLIRWGQQLQGEKPLPPLPVQPVAKGFNCVGQPFTRLPRHAPVLFRCAYGALLH